jgi:diaminopimelate epimerase
MHATVSHYSGCGNDFILIDDRKKWFCEENTSLISELCIQKAKVDGLILVQSSTSAHFKMKFFNNDGHEASMCGNGIRSLMRFLKEKLSFPHAKCSIETKNRILELECIGSLIRVEMGTIQELGWNIQLADPTEKNTNWTFHLLDSGVPHLVTFVPDVDVIDVAKIGSYFRHHPQFQPHGANVNFVAIDARKIRTFERGVEGETLACGTGATAAAYAMHKLYATPSPIALQVRSRDFLEIDIQNTDVHMTGPATWIRDAHLSLSEDKKHFTLTFKD